MIVGHHPGRGVEGGTPSEEKKRKKRKSLTSVHRKLVAQVPYITYGQKCVRAMCNRHKKKVLRKF